MLYVIYNNRNKYCLRWSFRILRHCTVYSYNEERKEQLLSRFRKILDVYISRMYVPPVLVGWEKGIVGGRFECAESDNVEEVTEV